MGNRPPINHLAQPFISLWTNRELVIQLVKRDILSKYRGSFAGILWSLLTPMLMLGLYTIVFGVFVNIRWPGVNDSLMYSLILYVGLIIFNFFAECLNRSPSLIVDNANFVKKIIFPLEIYSWVIVGTALFQALINTFILALFCLVLLGKVHLTILLFPLLFIPLILITLGISWFLSSMGVYVRDIRHAMVFVMQIIIYLSPVFYATSLLPELFQKVLMVNPLTFVIEQARSMVIFGNIPQWTGLSIYFFISLAIAWLGFIWFQKTRDGFADIL